MRLYAKIGTHPATYVHVVRKKKLPKIGEHFQVVDELDEGSKPIWVRCSIIKKISDVDLYYVERM